MKASRELRVGLLAMAIAWTAMAAALAESPTALGEPPSYEEIAAMARGSGEAPPSLLAYRLVLRFSPKDALGIPGEAYRLVKEADGAMRFGISPQEAGLRIRRIAALATLQGSAAEGMARFMREEDLRARLPGNGFGGPERGAGRLGPGIGRLSWSAGSGAASWLGAGGASPFAGGIATGGSGSPTGGTGPGTGGGPH